MKVAKALVMIFAAVLVVLSSGVSPALANDEHPWDEDQSNGKSSDSNDPNGGDFSDIVVQQAAGIGIPGQLEQAIDLPWGVEIFIWFRDLPDIIDVILPHAGDATEPMTPVVK